MIWLIVGVVVTVAVATALMMKKDDPFQIAANTLGLKLTRTVPELLPKLDGMVDGLAVKVDIAAQREPTIRYRVFYPALGMALRLERETTITRTLGQLGSGDSEIGAKQFDDSFRINTSRPDALKTMLTPQLRRQLLDVIERHPGCVIADGDITLHGETMTPPADTIVATVRQLVAAAAALVAVRPPALQVPEARPPVAPPTPRPATAPPSREDTGKPVPQERRAAPESSPQQPRPTAAPTEPIAPPEPQPPAAPPQPEPEPERTGLPDGFFEEVFGTNRMSYEDDERFEAEVRGTRVVLSGTVKQASRYEDQDDLSPASGTKAVVTVAQIETDLYGKSDIDAVVYLASAPDLNRGDEITFTGTLAGVDAFMRNLTIYDATTQA